LIEVSNDAINKVCAGYDQAKFWALSELFFVSKTIRVLFLVVSRNGINEGLKK